MKVAGTRYELEQTEKGWNVVRRHRPFPFAQKVSVFVAGPFETARAAEKVARGNQERRS